MLISSTTEFSMYCFDDFPLEHGIFLFWKRFGVVVGSMRCQNVPLNDGLGTL